MLENLCSYSSEKGLICIKHKVLKILNSKLTNNPINKWANKLNRKILGKIVEEWKPFLSDHRRENLDNKETTQRSVEERKSIKKHKSNKISEKYSESNRWQSKS
jgi:hypothetical protein